ncbi:hypothetical protein HanRHA438_Chr17g0805091 [Helianthus annuus]|nr:hypothetical protein HanRHA438_Chr17g0805091 [Helianthus annuus]
MSKKCENDNADCNSWGQIDRRITTGVCVMEKNAAWRFLTE